MTTPTQEGHGVVDPGHSSKNDTPTDPKKPAASTKTYIFDLTLGESNEETYPEFSWTELVKGAKAKEKHSKLIKTGATLLDPYASDDEDDLKAMAARFEQKYSSKTPNKSKKRKVEDYLDKGAGYDDNDSFIDNTDVYDEFVPPEVQTAHGGFYINSGSLEFKDVVMSDDEDTREKKAKANRKSAFPKPPYPKQNEEQKVTPQDSNMDYHPSSNINNKPTFSSESSKKDGMEITRIKPQSNSIKQQGPNTSNSNQSNPNKTKELDNVNVEKSTLSNSSVKSHEKAGAPPVKKVPRIIESSSSSSSSSSDDSSSSSDSDSSSSDEDDDNQAEDTEKTKEKIKQKEVAKELTKTVIDDKMPVLTPQTQPKVMPPLPALNPAPIAQKRLKTKNVPPNPNLHKHKPPLTSSPNVAPAVNKIVPMKNKDIFLGTNNVRSVSPNTNSVGGLSLPDISRRNQSPNSVNLSYVGVGPPTSTSATIIKIPTPKSTPTPTSSPLGLGAPIYTSANSANQQLKPSLPLNLLKPKPKPRVKKVLPGGQGTPLTAEDLFNTLQGLNSLTNAGLLSQAASSNNFVNKPVAKARLSKLTASSSTSHHLKGVMNSKKAQRLGSGQLTQKSLKLKSKHGMMSPLTSSVPLSSSNTAAAMLAFTNSSAAASLNSLSSFRPSPLTSAVEITKLRPAHMSSTSTASTNPNPFKSLTQQLGTGITVTEVGDKIRSSGSTSAPPTAIPSSSGTFVGSSSSSNNNVQSSNTNNISAMNSIGNSVSSANSAMNRILQAITITPSPLLNLTSTSGNDRSSASSNLNTFSSSSRAFTSSSASLQKPLKHITPYDVNAILGKMDPHVATSIANTNANNAMKASIEKIRLGNGINPREPQKK